MLRKICLQSCGPLWLGALHDKQFIETLLEDIEGERQNYGTFARMKGMLTMAKEVSDR
jgi:tRNA G26 N,N-dimethylase Trm1